MADPGGDGLGRVPGDQPAVWLVPLMQDQGYPLPRVRSRQACSPFVPGWFRIKALSASTAARESACLISALAGSFQPPFPQPI